MPTTTLKKLLSRLDLEAVMTAADLAGVLTTPGELLATLSATALDADANLMGDRVYTRAAGEVGYKHGYTLGAVAGQPAAPAAPAEPVKRGRPATERGSYPPVAMRVAPDALAAFDKLAIDVNGKRETRAETFERMVRAFGDDGGQARDRAVSEAIALLQGVFEG